MVYSINSNFHVTPKLTFKSDVKDNYVKPTADFKDSFNGTINKRFRMDEAKSQDDIPRDANIFIFNNKTKVNLPEGFNAKECILSDDGISTFTKMFKGPESNTFKLNGISAYYVHGDNLSADPTYGKAEVTKSSINQLENIKLASLDESMINHISEVEDVDATNSVITFLRAKGVTTLKDKTKVKDLKTYTLVTYPGSYVETAKTNYVSCQKDENANNKYSKIDNLVAKEGAGITQGDIGDLKTSELILEDSIANHVDADYGISIKNSMINNLDIGRINKITDCKVENFEIKSIMTRLQMFNKTQINNLTLNDNDAKLFVFPHSEWGKSPDNYIKNITVQNTQHSPVTPKLKIQGDIELDTVEFKDKPGILELTRSEDKNKPITVINGEIKYNVPIETPPSDDIE